MISTLLQILSSSFCSSMQQAFCSNNLVINPAKEVFRLATCPAKKNLEFPARPPNRETERVLTFATSAHSFQDGDLHDHDLFSEDGTMTPDALTDESPIHIGVQRLASQSKGVPVENLRRLRLHKKDFKRGGEALRGKNVVENFRVKEKDIKRTMK